MIKLALGLFSKNWVTFMAMALVAALVFQGNLLAERGQRIVALQMSTTMLNSQLQQHQAKAAAMDKIRRALHVETVTLRDSLRVRQEQANATAEAIMLQPVSREDYESLRWLRQSIRDLNFGSPP